MRLLWRSTSSLAPISRDVARIPVSAPLAPLATPAVTRERTTTTHISDMTMGAKGSERLSGSDAVDHMSGNNGHDMLSGGSGRNRLVGGSGVDAVDYSWSPSGASVNLNTNAYQRTTRTSLDSLIGIENVRGSASGDTLTGNRVNNSLEGGVGADRLSGMGGNDVLIGGSGVDTLLGGSGNDLLYVDEDDALVNGGRGFDTAIVDGDFDDSSDGQFSEVEEIRLGDGGNTLVMDNQSEDFRLSGGNGDDRAEGGYGSDSFQMGHGDDTIVADDLDALISGGRGTDTLELGNSVSGRTEFSGLQDDQILGVEIVNLMQDDMTVSLSDQTEAMTINGYASGASNINGGAGDETVNGGIGNDTIASNAGDDVINPGEGNDWIATGADDDTVNFGTELDGNDTADGGSGNADTLDFTDNSTGVDDLDNITGFEYINVGDAPTDVKTVDTLVASGATLNVDAGGLSSSSPFNWDGSAETDGTFNIESGAGDDNITGGAGNDTVNPGSGNETVLTGAGNDSVSFGAELDSGDTVAGGAGGADSLSFIDNGTGTDDLDNVSGFEYLDVGDAPTDIITVDTLVASGETLHVDASALTASSHFNWDGTAETDGDFDIESGSGADSIKGGFGDDTISSGAGNDTIVGGRGADILDGGAGEDVFIFANADQDFGRNAGIDRIQDFDPQDDTIVFSGWVNRDNNASRLMYEVAALGANESVASGAELLIVSDSAVSASGDVPQSIATALSSAFDVTSVAENTPSQTAGTVADADGDQIVRFAVKGDGNSYWVGEYRDSGFDDTISRDDIRVLGAVETGTVVNFTVDEVLEFFEQPAIEAPQALSLNLPADTGSTDSDPLSTQNQSVTVSGLENGNQLVYTVNGSSWTTLAADVSSFTLATGSYDAGDIQVRQVDPYGNYSAPGKTDENAVDVIIDRSPDSVTLLPEIDAHVGAPVVVEWENTRIGDAPLVSNFVHYRVDGGSWQQVSVSAGATSANLGSFGHSSVQWYVENEDAAGNVATSSTSSFDVRTVYWDQDAAPLEAGLTFVSLGDYDVSTYNGLLYYKGVGGSLPQHGYDAISTSALLFDFDAKSDIDSTYWGEFVEFVGPKVVNSIKVHDLDDKLGDYSGGLRDLGSTWFDTNKGNGILVINMDDVSADEGSTAPETRLQIDMDVLLADGGTENIVIDVYIDWADGIA